MDTVISLVTPLRWQSWWNTERVKFARRWCAFVGHDLSMVCDSDSERLYTVCKACGDESKGLTLHSVPIRHTWQRDRYELWLRHLETLRTRTPRRMRLVQQRTP